MNPGLRPANCREADSGYCNQQEQLLLIHKQEQLIRRKILSIH
jgi:hypothetical protein